MVRNYLSVTKLQVSDGLAASVWTGKSSFVLRLRLFSLLMMVARAASVNHESTIREVERQAALAILTQSELCICGFSMDVGQTYRI